jgi:hypothetical protein
MADETESQISDVPNLTEASAEVHEQFQRTEAERVRLAAATQGAIPRGWGTTTIPGRHGQLLKLGLFNSERHRIHTSVATLVDMDIMAAAVNTDAMGGFAMHIPNADYEDREIKRGTLMGKAHKLADWMPIDAKAAINMTKKPEWVLREHTREELEVIRKLITDNVNRTVPYQYWSEYIAMLMASQHFFSADNLYLGFTDLEQHTIDLKDKNPVFSPQF